jgi:hypothetical protein
MLTSGNLCLNENTCTFHRALNLHNWGDTARIKPWIILNLLRVSNAVRSIRASVCACNSNIYYKVQWIQHEKRIALTCFSYLAVSPGRSSFAIVRSESIKCQSELWLCMQQQLLLKSTMDTTWKAHCFKFNLFFVFSSFPREILFRNLTIRQRETSAASPVWKMVSLRLWGIATCFGALP